MKYSLPLTLLLALARPSLGAPVPLRLEDCLRYEPCRFALPSAFSQQEGQPSPSETTSLKNPHLLSHQLRPTNEDDAGDIRLAEHPRQRHAATERFDLQPHNSKLEALLRAAVGDKLSGAAEAGGWTDRPMIVEIETIPVIQASHVEMVGKTDARHHGLAGLSQGVWKKVESIALKSLRRCRTHRPTIIHQDSVGRDGWIIIYSYDYKYAQAKYTDILVVGIVVLFVAAMLLVEGLDGATRLTRRFLGLDEGQIRLEDNNCPRADSSSPYWLDKYYRISSPPRKYPTSTTGSGEPLDEKTTVI